jgi:hypothetical protein
MSFLHTWRRWTDNQYRWDTAAEQAIIDSQDDLIFEVQELRHQLAQLTEHLAPTRYSVVEQEENWLRETCEKMGIDYDNL